MSYAEKTSVSVDRSQGEIKKVLAKYNASAFAFVESPDKAMVQFDMAGKRIKFLLPLPAYMNARDKKGYLYSQKQVDQIVRAKWRALLLAIKAKLECVDAGIATLEQEFMAHIVLPNGQTVGEIVLPEIESSYQNKIMPLLLGMR